MSLKKHTRFHVFRAIMVLPFNVLITIPFLICYFSGSQPWSLISRLPLFLQSAIAGFCIVLGLSLMYQTISLFSKIGRGTPAPWNPTQKLVVQGPYRYVRNPMISGVLLVLLGEVFLLQSFGVFIEAVIFFTINYLYFIFKEEPDLEKRFGADYINYKNNVPRWIPRLMPWKP